MSPSELQEHQRQRESIYPLSRQELAVPEIPWIRLQVPEPPATGVPSPSNAARKRVCTPMGNGWATSKTIHRDSDRTENPSVAAPSNTLPTVANPADTVTKRPPVGRREIMEQLRRPSAKRSTSSNPVEPKESTTAKPSLDGTTAAQGSSAAAKPATKPKERRDAQSPSPVGSPNFLKHAVRFGGPSPLQATDRQLYEAEVSQFQQQIPHTLQSEEVAQLKGVDQRGRVYSQTVSGSAAGASSVGAGTRSTTNAFDQFIIDQNRHVEALPIIQVSTDVSNIEGKEQTLTRHSGASTLKINDDPTPYWIQALIQIVVGTAIIIAIMNLGQWIRSQNTQQFIEKAPTISDDFPVQQAQSLQTDRPVIH